MFPIFTIILFLLNYASCGSLKTREPVASELLRPLCCLLLSCNVAASKAGVVKLRPGGPNLRTHRGPTSPILCCQDWTQQLVTGGRTEKNTIVLLGAGLMQAVLWATAQVLRGGSRCGGWETFSNVTPAAASVRWRRDVSLEELDASRSSPQKKRTPALLMPGLEPPPEPSPEPPPTTSNTTRTTNNHHKMSLQPGPPTQKTSRTK